MLQTVTNHNQLSFNFPGLKKKEIVADFSGGIITSDAGGMLLRQVDYGLNIAEKVAVAFTDKRDQRFVEHSLENMLRQITYGICLGYEDLNDHDILRRDPALAAMVGHNDPAGKERIRKRDSGKALASSHTLGRLELGVREVEEPSRYQKIFCDFNILEKVLTDLSIELLEREGEPERIIIDIDSTDDPLHGRQEGGRFHAYYDCSCYTPLYFFINDHLIVAELRTISPDAAHGVIPHLERIVPILKKRFPKAEILLRGDSGFCRNAIMDWCEENRIYYLLGMAKNILLNATISSEMAVAKGMYKASEEASRVFTEFHYTTKNGSWNGKRRRIIAKAEYLEKGANPRFVVTNYPDDRYEARELYEDIYCARGEMENRIKEQQLCLFADRTSSHYMRVNQLRLWFASIAYIMMDAIRTLGLKGTKMSRSLCSTIRLKLFKIGAIVRVSVRRVYLAMSSAYPYQLLYDRVHQNLIETFT